MNALNGHGDRLMTRLAFRRWGGVLLLVFFGICGPVGADTARAGDARMFQLLEELTAHHERILKTQAKMDAARHRTREATGDWFPELDVTATTGSERQIKESLDDSALHYQELDLKLSQLLWDFGKTTGKVDKETAQFDKAKAAHESAMLKLLLDGARSVLNVIKHRETLQLAKKAEGNIFQQAELEKNLVTAGAGLGTDVLQANAQYAAAQTRSIRAEGSLIKAENEFRKLFKRELQEPLTIDGLESQLDSIQPKDLDRAIQIARETNADVRAARIDLEIARQELKQTRGKNYFPALTFDLDHKWQDNIAGTAGRRNVSTAGFKLNMPFNLGLTALDAVDADQKELIAAENQLLDTLNSTEEEVRNAWQELITLRAIAITLTRQADISAGFLELARQERKLGNRSLLDVLSGETSLINAQSDAASARIDVLIGMISLLKSTGQLQLELFAGQPLVSSSVAPHSRPVTDQVVVSASPDAKATIQAVARHEIERFSRSPSSAASSHPTRPAEPGVP